MASVPKTFQSQMTDTQMEKERWAEQKERLTHRQKNENRGG